MDTSALVALAFSEPGHRRVADRLGGAENVFASALLEAEFRSALVREEVSGGLHLLAGIRWVLPDRTLGPELERIFASGCTRGADAWHLATALFLVERPQDLPFLTLDQRQQKVAEGLGFPVPA